MQIGAPLAGIGQALPQPPQCETFVCVPVSQPSASSALQLP